MIRDTELLFSPSWDTADFTLAVLPLGICSVSLFLCAVMFSAWLVV